MKIVKEKYQGETLHNGREVLARFKKILIQKIQSKIIHRLRDEQEAREIAICISDVVDDMIGVLYVSTSVDGENLRRIPEEEIDHYNTHKVSHIFVEELVKKDFLWITKTDNFSRILYESSIAFIKDIK